MTISAIVITKNEVLNIERCLKSLAFADETIVVDAESTDGTAEIARQRGAKVIVRPWPGYGAQKNFGASQATGDWLLFIDADEEVTSELAAAIQDSIKQSAKDFYWLRIVTVFLGKPLRHLFGHNPRLFRRQAGKWSEQHVHEQVEHIEEQVTIKLGDDHSGIITTPLLHHSHPTVASYLKKMHHYTTLDAKHMAETGRHRSGRTVRPGALLPYMLASRQFLKMLFYRKGVFDGPAGWVWCWLSGYYEFEMGKKYLQNTSSV